MEATDGGITAARSISTTVVSTAVSEDELLTFLRSPASYAENPATVEIRQTHISIVALTPSHVCLIWRREHVVLAALQNGTFGAAAKELNEDWIL